MAFMRRYGIGGAILASLFGLASCDLSDRIDPQRPEVVEPVPESDLAEAPAIESADVDALPDAVAAKRDQILETADMDSIRRLVYLADDYDGFRSNYGDIAHYDHWYILKRAGIDPIVAVREILSEPYGVKDFGAEKYYIWPAFASRRPEDLDFSRLTFAERARLQELIGDDGIARVEAGEPYPGFRLAIRQDGIWVYLLEDN